MTSRVSEYLAERVADAGVGHVFTLTGGAMFLSDAFAQQRRNVPMALKEAVSRLRGRYPVTGPGLSARGIAA